MRRCFLCGRFGCPDKLKKEFNRKNPCPPYFFKRIPRTIKKEMKLWDDIE